jgi:hypothetical protein
MSIACKYKSDSSSTAWGFWTVYGVGIDKSIGRWLGTLRGVFLTAREAYKEESKC